MYLTVKNFLNFQSGGVPLYPIRIVDPWTYCYVVRLPAKRLLTPKIMKTDAVKTVFWIKLIVTRIKYYKQLACEMF